MLRKKPIFYSSQEAAIKALFARGFSMCKTKDEVTAHKPIFSSALIAKAKISPVGDNGAVEVTISKITLH